MTNLSSCCKAEIQIQSSDESISYFTCEYCSQPCDMYVSYYYCSKCDCKSDYKVIDQPNMNEEKPTEEIPMFKGTQEKLDNLTNFNHITL